MPALLHLGTTTTSGVLGFECLQPSLDISGMLYVPPPTFLPLVQSKLLAEHVKGQLRLLILVALCWMEVPWFTTVLNILANVLWQCPIIKDPIMDVLVGHMLKGLPYLHLTLWLLREMCVAQTGVLFLSLSGSDGSNLSIYDKGLPAVLEGMGRLVCLRGCTKQCHICP